MSLKKSISLNIRLGPIFVFSTGTKTSEKSGKKVEKKVLLDRLSGS
jgi:hypothetical protein